MPTNENEETKKAFETKAPGEAMEISIIQTQPEAKEKSEKPPEEV